MATIYNTALFQELKDGAKLQQLTDVVPSQLADKVVPVMEVNPKLVRVCDVIKRATTTTTGATTVYTIPAGIDFYLNSIILSNSTNVVNDGVAATARGTIEGVVVNLAEIGYQTLTARSDTITLSFPRPVKIDSGTTIQVTHTFTAGASVTSCLITGWQVENARA